MVKKLTRAGNSVAVVPDRAPIKSKKDADRFRVAKDWAHATYAGAFKRLAR